jgi:thermitase
VRRVLDVYVLTTKVTAITFRVTAANFVSPVLAPAEIAQVPAQFRKEVEAILKGLPAVGDAAPQVTTLIPTDGLVYDPELAHCCVRDPEMEQLAMIKLEREQAEAQKIGIELQLMALEVKRRQALLAAGTLTPFAVPSATTVVA